MSLTIVVADDAEDCRYIVRYLIESEGAMMTIVGEAADGEEALGPVRHRADAAHPARTASDQDYPHELPTPRTPTGSWPRTAVRMSSSTSTDHERAATRDPGPHPADLRR